MSIKDAMKPTWFILFMILTSCSLNNKKPEVNSLLITSLSQKDIAVCKNIIFRKRGDSLVKFQVRQFHRDFVLPFPNYPHDTIRESDDGDCYEYATALNIDSSFIHEYIRTKGDSLKRLIDKYNIIYLFNDEELGDFTIFQMSREGEFIYMPKNGVVRYHYWDSIIIDKSKISEDWYYIKK